MSRYVSKYLGFRQKLVDVRRCEQKLQIYKRNCRYPDYESVAYCDGSVRMAKRYSGLGVWYGEGDDRNMQYRIWGNKHDSNRAEMAAIYASICNSSSEDRLCIISDSQSCLDMIENFYYGDKMGSSRLYDPYLHTIGSLIDYRKGNTMLVKVKGHARVIGNVGADALARNAPDDKYLFVPDNRVVDIAACIASGAKMNLPHFFVPIN